MKRLFPLLVVLITVVLSSTAQYKKGYYDLLNGKQKAELKEAAKACVKSHKTLNYTDLPNYWQYSDVYPELVNGSKRWWDMYSSEVYLLLSSQTARSSFSANKMQREHSVPKSWWSQNGNVEYTPAYSDMWNLYPSDGPANQAKLNYPLGLTSSTTFNNGISKIGNAQTGYGGGSQKVFEPADEYKGDFARAYLYVATVYDDLNWVVNYMFRKEAYPTVQPWAIQMLLEWCRKDPVSQKEIDRNNAVEQQQGNRNPFIDFPELVEYIWGTRMTDVFYLADQPNVDPTPPISGDPELTMPVNGESLDFGQAAVGHTITRALQIAGKNFTMPLEVRLVGTNKEMFAAQLPNQNGISASIINKNNGYLLQVSYTPSVVGTHEAKLTFTGGGLPEEFSIVVNLRGEALEAPEFVALTATVPTNLTNTGYTAHWNPAPEGKVVDFYVLTRVKGDGENAEIETFETQETSLIINDRDPNLAEFYYVQYSRLGILSPISNKIYVGGSSVNEMQNYSAVRIYQERGGFTIGVDSESTELIVTNINGVIVINRKNVCNGERFSLPAGIYLVKTPHNRPQKLIVI